MMAVSKFLAGGVAIAALAGAAPAAAQYYPGYGYGYGNGGNVVGQVLNQVLGGSQYGYGYGVNSQAAVQRCAAAVEQRINRDYGYRSSGYGGYGGYSGYGGYGGYGYSGNGAGNARVIAVTSVERRSNGLRVRGVATANAYATGGYGSPYGGGYGGYSAYGGYAPQASGELTFKCNVDYRGYVNNVDLSRNSYANYGYRRY